MINNTTNIDENLIRMDLYKRNMELVDNYAVDFKRQCEEEASRQRISTGIGELDRLLSGGITNELYVLAAETSVGKSAFLQFLAQNIAKTGIYVLYFTIEMSRKEIFSRGIALESYIANKFDTSKPVYSISDIVGYKQDGPFGAFKKVPYAEYAEYANVYFQKLNKHLYIIEGDIMGLTSCGIYR
jgi:hypothetical protein